MSLEKTLVKVLSVMLAEIITENGMWFFLHTEEKEKDGVCVFHLKKMATRVRFELTRAEPIRLAV